MLYPSFSVVLLSALSRPVFGQADPAPSSLPDDVLPAANLTSDPLDRNITTVEIPVAAVPSLTNTSSSDETTTVSYFEIDGLREPLAVVYGDVILSTVPDLLNSASNSTESKVKRALSIRSTDNVWPGGVVNYKWKSEDAKGAGRLEAWTDATKRWTNMLPWLQFKEFPPSDTPEADILTLVDTTGQFACFSPIGKQWGGQMMLDDSCGGAGTYTHELGHTLGLLHEHQRPDRDDYVTIHCENVWDSADGSPADCSQACSGYGCNFVKVDPQWYDWSGPYDSLSLMHYSPYEFAKSSGPAIEARPGVPTPQAHAFPTILDANRICELYSEQCTGVCGNGKLEPGEDCDDGNNLDGDGCAANCKTQAPCNVDYCDPWNANSCHITTTCTALGGATEGGQGKHLCACRHGYKATRSNDTSVQVRLPWVEQGGRVFVDAGLACDTLCDDWQLGKDGCKEVKEEPVCY
ncbi:zincin [Paraphaeosphaeria sporulosa]|uniref:Metalloendopeptidase n=1 Tax=Paraphaeosphaeria sporulosa TaxID=1460663 RepID=A0A177BW85_9PLEO|nr:zincin [Paraphaeosphaeria sporulosa]OAF98777.1 zincin [Paraphaeosphaeria sporulosa]